MNRRYDIYTKKSVHFNLSKDGHSAFKAECAKRGLSMQEVIEEFVQRIASENTHVLRLLNEVAENKKNNVSKKFTKNDVTSIYEILEDEDPLKEK